MKKLISLFLCLLSLSFCFAQEERDSRLDYENINNPLLETEIKNVYVIKPHYSNKYVIENGTQYKAFIYNKKTKELVKTFDNVVSNWQGMYGWSGRVLAEDYTFVTADYKQYVVKARTYRVEYIIDERFASDDSPNPLVKTEYPDIFVIKPYLGSKAAIESGKWYKVVVYKKGSDDIVKVFDNVVSAWQGMTGWSGAVGANDFVFVTADYKQYIIKLKKYDVEVED
jgi:uncharacterized lipoprotein YehR (DUF1307 family)